MIQHVAAASSAPAHPHGSWLAIITGSAEFLYTWAFHDMPGVSIIIAVLTILVSVVTLHEKWMARKARKLALAKSEPTE